MSATNTTTNYNLPIFIGSDKPSWLADFNGAMNAIDAQMKTNADAIATKSPILTFNDTADIDFTKSGNTITANLASAVSDKVGRALITPITAPASNQIVGINTNGVQENMTIGSGLQYSSGVLNAIDLNLSVKHRFSQASDFRHIDGGYSQFTVHDFAVVTNAAGTIGKVYGYFSFRPTAYAYISVYTGVYVQNTSGTLYKIRPAGINSVSGNLTEINIGADGEIILTFLGASASTTDIILYWPCIYFFEDFGDV